MGHEQTGYIRTRFIGSNARLVQDIIEYCDKYNKTGLILFLDFEKAFDTVEWPFMFKTLQAFNFGENFINWIKTLYQKPSSIVKNNGYLSEPIRMERGIRQGCAISAMIFILVVEMLALKLKQNKNISGISISRSNGLIHGHLFSQYADDIVIFSKNEFIINPTIATVNDFSSVAGLRLNLCKTEGLWLCKLKYKPNNEKHYSINFPDNPIRSLGIFVGTIN